MATHRIITAQAIEPKDEQANWSLRPRSLDEFVGQPDLIERLRITIEAVRQRGEPMEHVLLDGPPGLGKTTMAHVIAAEMGSRVHVTSGPALTRPTDLAGALTKLGPNDIFFIDEIHRLPAAVEEFIYPAMEDFRIEVAVDSGMHARTVSINLKPFTLIGATTRAGLLTAPLRSRFGLTHHLRYYSAEDLLTILERSARLLNVTVTTDPNARSKDSHLDEPEAQTRDFRRLDEPEAQARDFPAREREAPAKVPGSSEPRASATGSSGAASFSSRNPSPPEGEGRVRGQKSSSSSSSSPPSLQASKPSSPHSATPPLCHSATPLSTIAARSRGTPRIANRLLRRVRDYAQVRADSRITTTIVNESLALEGVDALGLDELDRAYLQSIARTYKGGPVGLEALAATMGEDAGTLEDVVEPFLLQIGFLARTRRGRALTAAGAAHIGAEPPAFTQDNTNAEHLFG